MQRLSPQAVKLSFSVTHAGELRRCAALQIKNKQEIHLGFSGIKKKGIFPPDGLSV
jgi:hypothetical protein